jgi:hypothetical protein
MITVLRFPYDLTRELVRGVRIGWAITHLKKTEEPE